MSDTDYYCCAAVQPPISASLLPTSSLLSQLLHIRISIEKSIYCKVLISVSDRLSYINCWNNLEISEAYFFLTHITICWALVSLLMHVVKQAPKPLWYCGSGIIKGSVISNRDFTSNWHRREERELEEVNITSVHNHSCRTQLHGFKLTSGSLNTDTHQCFLEEEIKDKYC